MALQRSLLTGSTYGAYDAERTPRVVTLRPSYTGTPDWQQITLRYDSGQTASASDKSYGTKALLTGSIYGILSSGGDGRYHRRLLTGSPLIGRYQVSRGVVYDSDFQPTWSVQDRDSIAYTPGGEPTWAVEGDQEWVQWIPEAAVFGWRVRDTDSITWPDTGDYLQVRDTELIVWEARVTGDVQEGDWSVQDTERVRWVSTVGVNPDCITGDGVEPAAPGGVGNYVY